MLALRTAASKRLDVVYRSQTVIVQIQSAVWPDRVIVLNQVAISWSLTADWLILALVENPVVESVDRLAEIVSEGQARTIGVFPYVCLVLRN